MSQNKPRPTNDPKPQKAKQANQAANEEDELDEEESGQRFLFFNVMPSWMVSFITHIAVIIALAIMVMPSVQERTVALEAGSESVEALESIDLNLDALEFDDSEVDPFESDFSEEEQTEVSETEAVLPEAEVEVGNILGAEEVSLDADFGEISISEMANEAGGRTGDSKNRLLKEYGGS